MNIQATHEHPYNSAVALDDKRLIKMILESAQMYCTVTGDTTYRPTHSNHPVTKWAQHNLSWLIQWHQALAGEYFHRFKKTHKSFTDVGQYMTSPPGVTVDFCNAARGKDLDFTHIKDTHKAYRFYMRARWYTDKKPATWTNRMPPWWLQEKNTTGIPMIHEWDVWPRADHSWVVTINQKTRKRYE